MLRILKINREIINQILKEEYEAKLRKIDDLQIEQNMQAFQAEPKEDANLGSTLYKSRS